MKLNKTLLALVVVGYSLGAQAMNCDVVTYRHYTTPNVEKHVIDGEVPEVIEAVEAQYTRIEQVRFSQETGRLNCPVAIEVNGSRIELDPNHVYACIYSRPETRSQLDGKIRCQ